MSVMGAAMAKETPITPQDFNPDKISSVSGLWVEERDDAIYYVLRVGHLGAIVMRAVWDDDLGDTVFKGMSTFTNSEINGHSDL